MRLWENAGYGSLKQNNLMNNQNNFNQGNNCNNGFINWCAWDAKDMQAATTTFTPPTTTTMEPIPILCSPIISKDKPKEKKKRVVRRVHFEDQVLPCGDKLHLME